MARQLSAAHALGIFRGITAANLKRIHRHCAEPLLQSRSSTLDTGWSLDQWYPIVQCDKYAFEAVYGLLFIPWCFIFCL